MAPDTTQLPRDTTQHAVGATPAPEAAKPRGPMRPFMVEADCYSQLARVQRILAGQGLLQNHFALENWPEGLTPSTTAPFDYVILFLYALLWPFTSHPLDWAGALVSPALWIALVGFWMLIRSREFNLTGRALLIAGTAVLPSLIWGTAFGRPRHQSLILALMAMGLTAEYERWQLELTPKRAWNIFAGVVWGLACWTSLFEPVVVAGTLIVFNLIVRRRENPAFLIAFGVVLLAMTLLEGGHIFGNVAHVYALRDSPETVNWLRSIAEVAPLDFPRLLMRMAFVVLITPIAAWCLWPRRNGNKTDILLILLAAALTGLTCLQGRWVYYASLTGLFVIARFCQAERTPEGESTPFGAVLDRFVLTVVSLPFFYGCLQLGAFASPSAIALVVLGLLLIGLAQLPNSWAVHLAFGNPLSAEGLGRITTNCWMRLIVVVVLLFGSLVTDVDQIRSHANQPPLQPSLQLLQVSRAIDNPGGIMAPWWLSPGLLYFSGHPIVSGSSHAGMSGIIDSAKFFTATSWLDAEKILDRRQVRWIVVWDNPDLVYPVLDNAQQILGLPQATDHEPGNAEDTVVQRLIEDQYVPTAFRLHGVVEKGGQKFKLYEYDPNT